MNSIISIWKKPYREGQQRRISTCTSNQCHTPRKCLPTDDLTDEGSDVNCRYRCPYSVSLMSQKRGSKSGCLNSTPIITCADDCHVLIIGRNSTLTRKRGVWKRAGAYIRRKGPRCAYRLGSKVRRTHLIESQQSNCPSLRL